MKYEHLALSFPIRNGLVALCQVLDQHKNEMGYDLLSVVEGQAKASLLASPEAVLLLIFRRAVATGSLKKPKVIEPPAGGPA